MLWHNGFDISDCGHEGPDRFRVRISVQGEEVEVGKGPTAEVAVDAARKLMAESLDSLLKEELERQSKKLKDP